MLFESLFICLMHIGTNFDCIHKFECTRENTVKFYVRYTRIILYCITSRSSSKT